MNFAPHYFTLRQLQYALAVAESLSFNKAADACHVSQPSLSAQIADLEKALSVKLFERDRRQVLVTAAGREIIEQARTMLRDAEKFVETARRCCDPLAGTLRIGAIPTVSPYLLPHIAPALRAAFPRLTPQWFEDKTHVLLDRLNTGLLDAAVLALEADLGDIEHEAIARDSFVLVAPPRHRLVKKKTPAKPEELCDVEVLLLDDEHCFGKQVFDFCARVRARDLEFRATSLSTIVHMVLSGSGVTLLPELAVRTEVRTKGLRVRDFAEPAPGRTIGLAWRKNAPFVAAMRQIASTLRRAYPNRTRLRSSAGR
jgi:LysR family transcriptional regulator, hydrogen peroxide-inducible genes activator